MSKTTTGKQRAKRGRMWSARSQAASRPDVEHAVSTATPAPDAERATPAPDAERATLALEAEPAAPEPKAASPLPATNTIIVTRSTPGEEDSSEESQLHGSASFDPGVVEPAIEPKPPTETSSSPTTAPDHVGDSSSETTTKNLSRPADLQSSQDTGVKEPPTKRRKCVATEESPPLVPEDRQRAVAILERTTTRLMLSRVHEPESRRHHVHTLETHLSELRARLRDVSDVMKRVETVRVLMETAVADDLAAAEEVASTYLTEAARGQYRGQYRQSFSQFFKALISYLTPK